MSEALTIEKLLALKEEADLKEFAKKLYAKLERTQRELNDTKIKLDHLENLSKNSSILSVGSNEENLCQIEIKRLYDKAKRTPLEFNETKAFEIYVKSLLAIRGKSDQSDDKKKKKTEELSDEQLIALATSVINIDDGTEQ